jgi:hypothetical protein
MNLETHISAKIEYLLSTCHRFNNSFMSNMIRQYEETNTVACRHNFSFNINLHEPIDTNTNLPGAFEVKSTSFDFLESKSLIMLAIIQKHNNDILTYNEMNQIYTKMKQQNILSNTQHITGIYAVGSILKLYQNKYKSIFIPIILDYGRNHNLVHQCAIVVDNINGILMFYEPYGKYQKYDKSYTKCIKEFLTILTPVLKAKFFTNGELNYQTFHQHIKSVDGIQQIILNTNNSNKSTFNIEYKKLIQSINIEFPDYNIEPNNTPDPDDHTMVILDLLSNMDNISIDSLHQYKKDKYKELLNKTLQCYSQYNSKTCVSITIIELNEYFRLLQSKIPIIVGMKQYYSKFTGATPNKELMEQIYSMINVFHNNKLIKKIIGNKVNLFQICNYFKLI